MVKPSKKSESQQDAVIRNCEPIQPDRPYLIPEVAAIFDVNPSTVWKYCRSGGLKIRNTGRGVVMGSDLLDWIKSQPVKQKRVKA